MCSHRDQIIVPAAGKGDRNEKHGIQDNPSHSFRDSRRGSSWPRVYWDKVLNKRVKRGRCDCVRVKGFFCVFRFSALNG